MPFVQALPVLLVTSSILGSIDGALVLSALEYIKDVTISLIEVIIGFLVLVFVFRLLILLSTENEEIIILPFNVSTSKKTYNGNIISDFLLVEMRNINEIHDKFEEKDTVGEKIHLPKMILNTGSLNFLEPVPVGEHIHLLKLAPDTEQFETTVSNLGNINIAGMTLSIGSILTVLKRLWPLGEQARTIKGSLQEYDSEIHLIALMQDPKARGWDISVKIEQLTNEDKIPELIKDLAFIITYDLSTEETKEKERITAKTWTGLKYFTESLDYYSQYITTKKTENLKKAWDKCIKASQEEKDYQILFNLFYSLGFSYYHIKDYHYAEDAFRHCIELEPNSKNGLIGLGAALDNLGRYGEALEAYNKVLEIDPTDATAWSSKGNALNGLGQYKEALKALEKALDIDPKNEYAWNNKGNALNGLGQLEGALAALDKALEINPANANAWNDKGNALGGLGRYEEAIKAYNEALKIYPKDATALSNKGNALNGLDRYEEALKTLEKALEIDPKLDYTWNNIGNALNGLGRRDEALKAYDRALKINPNNPKALYSKNVLLVALGGRQDEALEAYDRAMEIYERTLKAYERALKTNPKSVYLWYDKARTYSLMNKRNEALADLKHAVELDPYYRELAKSDKNFEKLWEDEDFKEIVTASSQ